MLLETFDSEGNSLVVFSRNILNSEENFRMVFKKDSEKAIRKLFLYDICGLINNSIPKNLIAYRLLTNLEEISLKRSELGCFIQTEEGPELIFPDPIYAVKELENIAEERFLPNLKFRIQQVGFISTVKSGQINFREVFHFDMESLEAQAQNDTVFVEAILKDESRYKAINTSLNENLLSEVKAAAKEKINNRLASSLKEVSLKSILEKNKIQSSSSVIKVFKSADLLLEYIKPKLKKRIVLKFKKK